MVPYKLIDGGPDDDSIFLINQDSQVTLRSEDGEEGRDDTWPTAQLNLPSLI